MAGVLQKSRLPTLINSKGRITRLILCPKVVFENQNIAYFCRLCFLLLMKLSNKIAQPQHLFTSRCRIAIAYHSTLYVMSLEYKKNVRRETFIVLFHYLSCNFRTTVITVIFLGRMSERCIKPRNSFTEFLILQLQLI